MANIPMTCRFCCANSFIDETVMRILKLFSELANDTANVFTVIGGALGLYAVSHPETISSYLDRIDGNVAVISESIPLWPVLENVSFSFDPPTSATLSVEVMNPKNILVSDFSGHFIFSLSGAAHTVEFGGPSVIPPNEEISLGVNIIREPWFREVEDAGGGIVDMCMAGQLETDDSKFFEFRRYSFDVTEQSVSLVDRQFSRQEAGACDA